MGYNVDIVDFRRFSSDGFVALVIHVMACALWGLLSAVNITVLSENDLPGTKQIFH